MKKMKKTKKVTVDQLLKKTRGFLHSHKWTVCGDKENQTKGFCVIGCLEEASKILGVYSDNVLFDRAMNRLDAATKDSSIILFNDAKGTTKKDIRAAITRAIYRHY